MDRSSWQASLDPDAAASLAEVWIPIGLPGFAGDAKHRRQEVLDGRFGEDGWRIGHVVRGRIVAPSEAIVEYEAAYRRFLRDRPPLVRFLATTCGNVYDDRVENVFDTEYEQPHTHQNHYQDIAVRRVIAELADDRSWPDVVPTADEQVDLVDLGTGESHHVPRAYGFAGSHLLQIREPLSPGYVLNPAVVPVHDASLITSLPVRAEWYHAEGCGHLSVEAFWQMSKVIEVRYDRWLALGEGRSAPLAGDLTPVPSHEDRRIALLGPLSLDIYLGRDLVLPGGGALNMAWWWRHRAPVPFELLSRVGTDRPEVFEAFIAKHAILVTPELVAPGPSASIDIEIRPDLQPHMDNFVEGVWDAYTLSTPEIDRVRDAGRLHVVLVEGAVRELSRLATAGALEAVQVSADFLGFRHYSLERLADTMRSVDIGFVGWPGSPDDESVAGIRAVAHGTRRLIVVTFGSQGVWAFDGRPGAGGDAFVAVRAVPVLGTTLGCGDAFIAGFLAEWWQSADLRRAIDAGKVLGAAATAWRRPLPDDAYGDAAAAALRRVDEAAAAALP